MDFAMALLTVQPAGLRALGWTFADRKRLLDHFLASDKAAQTADPRELRGLPIELALPQCDVDRLQRFARLDRVLAALDVGSHGPDDPGSAAQR